MFVTLCTSNTEPLKPADVQEPPNLEATKHPDINDASAVLYSSIKLQVPELAKANKHEINDVRKKLNIEWLFHSRVSVKKIMVIYVCILFICMYYTQLLATQLTNACM